MKPEELMKQLAEMHPGAYALEGLSHWTEIAIEALDQYQGACLRLAFDEVTKDWSKGWAPKPGDFVDAAKRARVSFRGARDLPEVRDTPTTRRSEFAQAASYVAGVTGRDLEQCRRIVANWLAMGKDDLDLIVEMLDQHRRRYAAVADLLVWIQTRIAIRMETRQAAPPMSELGATVRRRRAGMVDDWLRDNAFDVEDFLDKFADDDPAPERYTLGVDGLGVIARPSDRQRARRKLVELLRTRAQDVALAQASNGAFVAQPHVIDDPERRRRAQIEIVEADFARIALEVDAQRYRSTIAKALGYALPSPVLRDGPEPAREITAEDWAAREAGAP